VSQILKTYCYFNVAAMAGRAPFTEVFKRLTVEEIACYENQTLFTVNSHNYTSDLGLWLLSIFLLQNTYQNYTQCD
jgi:hypothetical protein